MTKKDIIIVNSMFVGDYGKTADNLPHEVINLYKTDDDKTYIYLPPYGRLGFCKDRIKGILFVRSAGNGFVEILGKVDNICESYVDGLTIPKAKNEGQAPRWEKIKGDFKEKNREIINSQNKITEEIKYGECSLADLHKSNEGGIPIYVSCKVNKFYLPEKTHYLALDEEKCKRDPRKNSATPMWEIDNSEEVAKINNQSMRVVYSNEKEDGKQYRPNQYKILCSVLKCEELWNEGKSTTKYDQSHRNDEVANSDNIFKVARQQDNEVLFSNMLFYFFSKYKQDILFQFIGEVLSKKNKNLEGKVKIDNNKDSSCIVEREKDRMDICIRGKDYCIILENKIKSGINGIKAKLSEDDDPPEPCKVDTTKREVVDKSTEKISSQLSKYYNIARDDYKYAEDKIFCFVLRPEYVGKLNLDDYLDGDKYTQISYKELYDFFNTVLNVHEKKKQEELVFIEDEDICYLNQFCKALYKHTKAVDDEFRTDMLIRMKARIDEINKAKPTSAVQPVLPNNN